LALGGFRHNSRMAIFDLPLRDLQDYLPEMEEPSDLEDFWRRSVAAARTHEPTMVTTPVDNRLAVLDTYDVTFPGFGGNPVKAWLHVPAGASGPLPTVVQYHGYSGGRGLPHSWTLWAQAGYAQLTMDTRGQGWAVGGGPGTPDASVDAGAPHPPGFLTAGITDPAAYYYRRVYVDAVRLLEVAQRSPLVDPERIVVTGVSQGGGLSIAAAGIAAMVGIDVLGAAPDVPFLCHFRRATELSDARPYAEITEYLAGWREHVDAAFHTLSYFDCVNLGRRASASALFSAALRDQVCPPSTVFAAYNHYGALASSTPAKDIRVYAHNGHEGGKDYQSLVQLDWLRSVYG
jgi:cephalosporin-C deacetylase